MTPVEMRAFADELAAIEKEAGIQYLYGLGRALKGSGRTLAGLYRKGAKKGGWQQGLANVVGGAGGRGGLSQIGRSAVKEFGRGVRKAEHYAERFAPREVDKVRRSAYTTIPGRQGAMWRGLTSGWAE
jgi:hypothetical protein